MAEPPSIITETKDVSGLARQTGFLLDDLYRERLAGASIGDVFILDDNDVLTLEVSSTGGLQKTSNELAIKIKTDGGIQGDTDGISINIKTDSGILLDSDGISIKVKANSGLKLDSDGIQVVVRANYGITMGANGLALIKQLHEADASVAHAVNDWATTNTALNALGTKINNILAKLEALKAFASS